MAHRLCCAQGMSASELKQNEQCVDLPQKGGAPGAPLLLVTRGARAVRGLRRLPKAVLAGEVDGPGQSEPAAQLGPGLFKSRGCGVEGGRKFAFS